jgi:hypothetical protein
VNKPDLQKVIDEYYVMEDI